MRFELVIILITGFLIYNTYHDNKYTKMLYAGKNITQCFFMELLDWDYI